MNENEFWIALWKIVAAVLCVIAVTIGGCSTYETQQIAKLASAGVDPIKSRCAVSGVAKRTAVICYSVATK